MINLLFSRYKLCFVFIVLVFLIFNGCASTMVVTPQLEQLEINPDFQLRGIIEYDGNKDYLPHILKEDPTQKTISFKYEYQVAYGRDNLPQLVPLYSPLSIVGFPIGKNTIIVKGNLTILKRKEVVKEYSATCGLERVRNIFSEGETFTELRKKGLFAVRDNIDLQMYNDRDMLIKYGLH